MWEWEEPEYSIVLRDESDTDEEEEDEWEAQELQELQEEKQEQERTAAASEDSFMGALGYGHASNGYGQEPTGQQDTLAPAGDTLTGSSTPVDYGKPGIPRYSELLEMALAANGTIRAPAEEKLRQHRSRWAISMVEHDALATRLSTARGTPGTPGQQPGHQPGNGSSNGSIRSAFSVPPSPDASYEEVTVGVKKKKRSTSSSSSSIGSSASSNAAGARGRGKSRRKRKGGRLSLCSLSCCRCCVSAGKSVEKSVMSCFSCCTGGQEEKVRIVRAGGTVVQ
jgi:hypothetical protein